MKLRDFQEAVRRLHCIDMNDLINAGAFIFLEDQTAWARFRRNPADFLIRADDKTGEALWIAITANRPFRGEVIG